MCCGVICPCFYKRRKATSHTVLSKDPVSSAVDSMSSLGSPMHDKVPPSPLRVPPSPSRFAASPKLSRLGSVHVNLSQVARATRNFSSSLRIGEGGFGTVYKAQLDDGQIVAIKRAKKETFENLRTEFSSEVELLAKIDHRNLVKLLGYVDTGNERLLITEYVANGTLREHLDEKQIIHRDVKSSNILLTESMRAKVADFGFARLVSVDSEQTHISTKVKGTVGYLDPEYMKTYQLTPMSDVYSFGILLLEILTGRRPVELKRPPAERVTLRWAFQKYNEYAVAEIVDPLMEETVGADILRKMATLAIRCAAPVKIDRPDMKAVGEELWGIRSDYLKSSKRG
ncbi:Calmodulin-binding receptor-like cytoplasmic kinase 3 [Linum grandiflorum]